MSDITGRGDRSVKAPDDAWAGVPEYWLVDLTRDRVDVHRQPVEGRYRTVRAYRPGERFTPEALPGMDIAVGDILW